MERLRTLNSYKIFKIKNKKLKTYSGWCPFKVLSNDTTLMQIQSGRTVPLMRILSFCHKVFVLQAFFKIEKLIKTNDLISILLCSHSFDMCPRIGNINEEAKSFSCRVWVCINAVCNRGWGWDQVLWRASTGVIHCVFAQIPNLQNSLTIPDKNLGGKGASDR